MQLLRDGLEDFEYLHALTALGDGAFAQAQARTFVTNPFTFSTDPTALASVREALGNRLHAHARAGR